MEQEVYCDEILLGWLTNELLLIIDHVKWLKGSGLVVNESKTEVCLFHTKDQPRISLSASACALRSCLMNEGFEISFENLHKIHKKCSTTSYYCVCINKIIFLNICSCLVNRNHEIQTLKGRKIFLLHWYLNTGTLESKATALPMSNTDPSLNVFLITATRNTNSVKILFS